MDSKVSKALAVANIVRSVNCVLVYITSYEILFRLIRSLDFIILWFLTYKKYNFGAFLCALCWKYEIGFLF